MRLSQVIVTDDELRVKRERTRKQEHLITVGRGPKSWQRSLIKKNAPVTVIVGYAVMPIVAIWGFVVGCIVVAMKILQAIFQGLGKLIGGKKSLITGK